MGLDLTLFSISNKANFVLEKAKSDEKYANDFEKIQDINSLRLCLRMVQSNPDGTPKNILEELIEDSKVVLSYYTDSNINKYQFHSRTRGYETLNYLLIAYLKSRKINVDNNKVFFSGTNISNSQHQLQYLDNLKTLEISNLLQTINFSDIVEFYDYEKIKNLVYKLTRPENLAYLEVEFEELKTFFNEAKLLNSFVVIKIN